MTSSTAQCLLERFPGLLTMPDFPIKARSVSFTFFVAVASNLRL